MTTRHDMSWYRWRDATFMNRVFLNLERKFQQCQSLLFRYRHESEIGCCCLPVASQPFDWRYEYDCLRHMIVDLCPEYLSHEAKRQTPSDR